MLKHFAVGALLLLAAPALFAATFPLQPDNLIVPLGAAPQLLIPAAGAVQGANGTFFRSDITIINYAAHDQNVQLRWLPNGVAGSTVAPRQITIPALTGIASEDFVTTFVQQAGLGALLITSVDASGNPDTSGLLYATSRIWSNQPGVSSGTVSQSFPSLVPANLNNFRLSLIGLKRDDRYRLNVGIVNLDPNNAQSFQVIAAASGSATEVTSVTVPPLSMVQAPITGAAMTNLQVYVQNATASTTRTTAWAAYGSSVDNVTGDSWSEIGYTAPPDQAATP
jgi:hypothetical protein